MTLDDLTDLIVHATPEQRQRFADAWATLPIPGMLRPAESIERFCRQPHLTAEHLLSDGITASYRNLR